MIASLSGIRGVLNEDMSLADVSRFVGNFVAQTKAGEVLIARDSRSTGPTLSKAVAGAAMSHGAQVVDYGIISTPALFRESRARGRPAVMITASHNEPEFNGLKFILDGRGIGKEVFDAVMKRTGAEAPSYRQARYAQRVRSGYVDDLVGRFGEGSFRGIKVALDLGGGAAISHAEGLLGLLGCDVASINSTSGIFNRKVDPLADELVLLRKIVRARGCDIGLAFDCDGDRLAIVDARGNKRTGDFMLTLALKELVSRTGERKAVVSQDTTQAIEEVFARAGGVVVRSKVGEANVVEEMIEGGARLGGEGSSGGLIDGDFNYCRDSMLAALVILGALKREGPEVYDSVPSYHQSRVAFAIPRAKALRAMKKLASRYEDSDSKDGVKVRLSRHSWVLVRPSGTEDVVRVSAEADTASGAEKITGDFARKLKELSR